jgi:hypothetical protein
MGGSRRPLGQAVDAADKYGSSCCCVDIEVNAEGSSMSCPAPFVIRELPSELFLRKASTSNMPVKATQKGVGHSVEHGEMKAKTRA